MAQKRKRWKSKEEKQRWLASGQGQLWLEKKIAAKHALRPDPGPKPERLTRTKFPFEATINGDRAIVWPDWIEYPEEDLAHDG